MRNPSIFALLLSAALLGADTAPLAEASIGIRAKPAKLESLDSATLQKMAILKLANENRTVKRRVAELEKKLNLLLSSSGKNLYTLNLHTTKVAGFLLHSVTAGRQSPPEHTPQA